MSVLVIAEHHQQELKTATLNTLHAAALLQQEIKVLVAGYQCEKVVAALKKYAEIKEILYVDHESFQHSLAENTAELIVELAKDATHILAPATTFGKNLLPRVAALLDVAQISDVIKIIDSNTYQRPIYAGNALATVQSSDPVQVVTVRPTAFAAVTIDNSAAPTVTTINKEFTSTQSRYIKEELQSSDRPELATAEIVLAGGRGLKDKASFEHLIRIADQMHAAVGASRAAVDAGLAPNDFQVGQTGQVVAPKLYFAVGISGAIQHLAGMKDSQVIVAINKDPEAPIFQLADFGLVGNIEDILPRWEAWLKENIK